MGTQLLQHNINCNLLQFIAAWLSIYLPDVSEKTTDIFLHIFQHLFVSISTLLIKLANFWDNWIKWDRWTCISNADDMNYLDLIHVLFAQYTFIKVNLHELYWNHKLQDKTLCPHFLLLLL